jgi:RNA recognition motif-containing protein
MNILVRNLSREITEKELHQMFLPFGRIKSVDIVFDKITGRSKGFGFVEMSEDSEARAAIAELNGKLIRGEKVRVKTTNQKFNPGRSNPNKTRSERFPFGFKVKAGQRKNRSPSDKRRQRPFI